MRKQANRINFNQAEEEFLDGDETVGLGVLGAKGQVRCLRGLTLQLPALLRPSGRCRSPNACLCPQHPSAHTVERSDDRWLGSCTISRRSRPAPCSDSAV